MTGLIVFAGIICILISLVTMKKSGHFVKSFLFTAIQGIAALLAVNAGGTITGVALPLNALTLGSGIVFGTPGIIMNLIAEIILA